MPTDHSHTTSLHNCHAEERAASACAPAADRHAPPVTALTGARGEETAAEFLRAEGFTIIHRNWRDGRFEIDIVAEKGERLHFVEVKTRSGGSWISPEEAFDGKKSRILLRAANRYVELYNIECEVQIDLVAVDVAADGQMQVRYYPEAANIYW